ncbi:MAG: hypothetical protein AAF228_01625 [Pseudomonadota bacterium]
MAKPTKPLIALLVSFCLSILPFLQTYKPAHAQLAATEISCNVSSEQAFRKQLEIILQDVLQDTVQHLNYKFIVDTSWTQNRINTKIDNLVDLEVNRLRADKSILELVQTLTSQKAREQLAQELATSVYGSEKFEQTIELIATDVGNALSKKLDILSLKAADPISQCVQKFIGPQYGQTIASLVSTQTRNQMTFNPDASQSQTSVTDIIKESSVGLTGGLLLILRQTILTRLSQALGRRLVGALVTRAVGAAVSIIGWILVAKELWDLRLGVLPIIAKEMKSDEAKTRIQTELISELKVEVNKILKTVPPDISRGIIDLWLEFKKQNQRTVDLTKNNPEFRQFLQDIDSTDDKIKIERLRKTNKVISLLFEKSGESGINQALERGLLKRAIVTLPEPAVDLAVDNNSLQDAFSWYELANTKIDKVVQLQLHKTTLPDTFTQSALQKLLSLQDTKTITSISGFSVKKRNALLGLSKSDFKTFSNQLSPEQLSSLAFYLSSLEPNISRKLVSGIKNNPQKIILLDRTEVRNGILASSNQQKAISYILREPSSLEFLNFPDDAGLVLQGEIHPFLLWSKQPFAVMISGFIFLLLSLSLYRLIFGRRKPVVVQYVPQDISAKDKT